MLQVMQSAVLVLVNRLEMKNHLVEITAPLLPKYKPRYLMGVGTPQDLLDGVLRE